MDGLIDDALAQIGADFAGKWPLEIAGWLSLAESRLNQVYDYIEQFLAPLELANRSSTGSRWARCFPSRLNCFTT